MTVADPMIGSESRGDHVPGNNLAAPHRGSFHKGTESNNRHLRWINNRINRIDSLLAQTRYGNGWFGDFGTPWPRGPMPNLASDPALWPGISEGWVSTDGTIWTPLEQSRVVDDFDS